MHFNCILSIVDNNGEKVNSCSIVKKSVADYTIRDGYSIVTQDTNNTVSRQNQWLHPKAFTNESEDTKISMILKWIFGPDSYEGILNGKVKINNITVRLEKMKFNGYLRLFEVDMSIILNRMTVSSWTLFNDFKTKRQNDAWKCPQCTSMFAQNTLKWKCQRCLFWYHEKCTKERKIKCKENLDEDYSLCDSCFFALL